MVAIVYRVELIKELTFGIKRFLHLRSSFGISKGMDQEAEIKQNYNEKKKNNNCVQLQYLDCFELWITTLRGLCRQLQVLGNAHQLINDHTSKLIA